jgi:hypothetical protein
MVRKADTARSISVRWFLRGIFGEGTPYAGLSYGMKSDGLIDASHHEYQHKSERVFEEGRKKQRQFYVPALCFVWGYDAQPRPTAPYRTPLCLTYFMQPKP